MKPLHLFVTTNISNMSLIEAEQLMRSVRDDPINILRFLSDKAVQCGYTVTEE